MACTRKVGAYLHKDVADSGHQTSEFPAASCVNGFHVWAFGAPGSWDLVLGGGLLQSGVWRQAWDPTVEVLTYFHGPLA